LLDDRLFLSAAAFYMDIKNIHVFVFDGNTGSFITSNAADASSYGLEVEADFLINERWQANAALAVINAEYDDYTDFLGNVNDGNKIERTPAHKINLGLQYNDPSGFYGRADLANVGNHYFDATNLLEEERGTRPWISRRAIRPTAGRFTPMPTTSRIPITKPSGKPIP